MALQKLDGWGPKWETPTKDIAFLLDTIIEYFDSPKDNPGTLQLQIRLFGLLFYIQEGLR